MRSIRLPRLTEAVFPHILRSNLPQSYLGLVSFPFSFVSPSVTNNQKFILVLTLKRKSIFTKLLQKVTCKCNKYNSDSERLILNEYSSKNTKHLSLLYIKKVTGHGLLNSTLHSGYMILVLSIPDSNRTFI